MTFKPYPKVYNIGSKGFERIFELPVEISEKIDGSNVSIHRTEEGIKLASRSKWLSHQSPGDVGMFSKFVNWVRCSEFDLSCLPLGSALWGEFSNNHNVLKYEKTCPFILFDVSYTDEFGNRKFLPRNEWNSFFRNWFGSDDFMYEHLNPIKVLFTPQENTSLSRLPMPIKEWMDSILKTPSMLGGKIEGIAIKNYTELTSHGELLFCKYVAPEFKEQHRVSTKGLPGEPIEKQIADSYYNDARLVKAISRLKEDGRWTGELKDIGPLIGIVNQDIYTECEQDIKQDLFDHFWKQITRMVTSRIPQNYKDHLEKNNAKT